MRFKTLVNPPAVDGGILPGLCKAHPVDTKRISGVLEIARDFDVILFSTEDTLTKNGKTHPAGAVLVPSLRRMERKLAMFSADPYLSREEVAKHVNYLGLSFAPERILLTEDFDNLKAKFPLAHKSRILMVCSDIITEVALGQAQGLTTLLITNEIDQNGSDFGIEPDYIATSV
ncbi:MAG: hypothetical protein HWE30_06075 [Methylocystaceae bacterium]|nr:hypothetical protein [Methylocystaceae bacterium]